MGFLEAAAVLIICLVVPGDASECSREAMLPSQGEGVGTVQGLGSAQAAELKAGAIDVEISAKGAIAWDQDTGQVLYERRGDERRPVASLSKLLAALAVRDNLELWRVIKIPAEVIKAQRAGANIKLPVGGHATAKELLAAGMIASANDAMVALAVGGFGSEEELVRQANLLAGKNGWQDTAISNATGLTGGDQYSTPRDIMGIFQAAYSDPYLAQWMAEEKGELTTEEGASRRYTSTNKLLGTYLPVLAAKTGYTIEAGENLVLMTRLENGRIIGAAVFESQDRFFDMKALVGWLGENYLFSNQ